MKKTILGTTALVAFVLGLVVLVGCNNPITSYARVVEPDDEIEVPIPEGKGALVIRFGDGGRSRTIQPPDHTYDDFEHFRLFLVPAEPESINTGSEYSWKKNDPVPQILLEKGTWNLVLVASLDKEKDLRSYTTWAAAIDSGDAAAISSVEHYIDIIPGRETIVSIILEPIMENSKGTAAGEGTFVYTIRLNKNVVTDADMEIYRIVDGNEETAPAKKIKLWELLNNDGIASGNAQLDAGYYRVYINLYNEYAEEQVIRVLLAIYQNMTSNYAPDTFFEKGFPTSIVKSIARSWKNDTWDFNGWGITHSYFEAATIKGVTEDNFDEITTLLNKIMPESYKGKNFPENSDEKVTLGLLSNLVDVALVQHTIDNGAHGFQISNYDTETKLLDALKGYALNLPANAQASSDNTNGAPWRLNVKVWSGEFETTHRFETFNSNGNPKLDFSPEHPFPRVGKSITASDNEIPSVVLEWYRLKASVGGFPSTMQEILDQGEQVREPRPLLGENTYEPDESDEGWHIVAVTRHPRYFGRAISNAVGPVHEAQGEVVIDNGSNPPITYAPQGNIKSYNQEWPLSKINGENGQNRSFPSFTAEFSDPNVSLSKVQWFDGTNNRPIPNNGSTTLLVNWDWINGVPPTVSARPGREQIFTVEAYVGTKLYSAEFRLTVTP